jgi:predicted HicB family RNase H-like nuclease
MQQGVIPTWLVGNFSPAQVEPKCKDDHLRIDNVTQFTLQKNSFSDTNAALRVSMSGMKQKTETLNLRVSPKVKAALQAAARREHRSMANMVEHLVLRYCEEHGLVMERETEGVAGTSNLT